MVIHGLGYTSWIWILLLFIALIHPIQWTIANLVGVDRPAKTEKVVLCFHRLACPTVHSPGGASYSFLSRQRDVIVSFSFGACTVQTDFRKALQVNFGGVLLHKLFYVKVLLTTHR